LLRDHLDSEWADETRISLSKQLEHDLTDIGDTSGAVEAIFGRLNGLGRDEALVEIERAKHMALEAGNPRLHLDGLLWQLAGGFMASTPASELVDLAREIIENEDSDLGYSAMAMGFSGGALQLLGEWDEGRAAVARGMALVEELGLETARVGAFSSGIVERIAGDIDRAESLVGSAIRELDEAGEKNRLSTLAATMAGIKAIKGEVEVSERWISKATDAAAPDDADTFAEIASARGETALHLGQFEEAADHFRSATELLATRDMGWWQSVLKLRLAAALAGGGDTDQARSTINEAIPALEAKDAVVIVAQAREQLANLDQ
jgi:tetratricopeptide (TPR) repeat protein